MRYEKSLRSLRSLRGNVPSDLIHEAYVLYELGMDIGEIEKIINFESLLRLHNV